MGTWILWAAMLLLQNASFTLVSRARNSSSILFHAAAAVGSNGVFILTQLVALDKLMNVLKNPTPKSVSIIFLFYTFFTVLGSITMHHVSMKYLEKGKRKVGSN